MANLAGTASEAGMFFREKKLKTGTVMSMPDIRDKMPKRSFLPRVIASKLPFSISKLGDLMRIFHVDNGSSMAGMLKNGLADWERAPFETKMCVSSAENMIDFAISVLGRNIAIRSTENTDGSDSKIMIGAVKVINGKNVTKSISCHEMLFPYLL